MMKHIFGAFLCAMIPVSLAQGIDEKFYSGNATIAELCAVAQTELKQDTATLQFSFDSQHKDKRQAADEVNRTVDLAIKKIKAQYPKVKVITGDYHTYQNYSHQGQTDGWRATQSFTVETKDMSNVEPMTAMLQSLGLSFHGVDFGLTHEERNRTQGQLYKMAFDDVQQRLKWMAQGMSKTGEWQIIYVDATNNNHCGGNVVAPMLAAKMYDRARAQAEVAQPNLGSGTEEVRLNLLVRAKIK